MIAVSHYLLYEYPESSIMPHWFSSDL